MASQDRPAPVDEAPAAELAGPWPMGTLDRPAPWGVDDDSPMDEGSEATAVPEGELGDRRAGQPEEPDDEVQLGTVEPTATPEAGPGGAPDPAPRRRPFPDAAET